MKDEWEGGMVLGCNLEGVGVVVIGKGTRGAEGLYEISKIWLFL